MAAGIAWVLFATFAFSVVTASGKFAGGEVPAVQIVFLRYAGGLAAVLAIMGFRGLGRAAFITARLPGHVLRAVCSAGGVGCSLYAATHMPLATAAAIGLTQVVYVVLLAWLVLHERVTPTHWVAVLLCLVGGVVAALGRGAADLAPEHVVPALVALAGAMLGAGELIAIKTLASGERPVTVLLYVNLLGGLMLAVPVWFLWAGLDQTQTVLLPMLGPLAILAQYCNIRGFRVVDAVILGPVSYSRILFAGVIGYVAFGERPGAMTWFGAALIVVGGLVLTRLRARD